MEELQKALNEKNLSVSTNPEKGRCLFTTHDFAPGEFIISENPYVCVPSKNKESAGLKCEWCFSSKNLKKCSSCHVVWYCSSYCQKLDWKMHRVECQCLSKVEGERVKYLTPSIRLMVKLCLRRQLEYDKCHRQLQAGGGLGISYPLVFLLARHCAFLDIMTHVELFDFNWFIHQDMADIDEKQLVLYAQMANLVNLILQWPDSEINIKEIAENFSKLACNAHTICDSELIPHGTGLYPVISIINHSCLPNSVLVFEGRLAVVRAVQHIPKGTEVLISYIETAGSTVTRQKALKEQYLFSCTCSRCIKLGQFDDIRESAILEGYSCKNGECSGFLLRNSDGTGFICQQCGLLRDKDDIKTITTEVKLMSEKASMFLSAGRYAEASAAYMMIEKLQMKLDHPFSVNLMRTRETLLKAHAWFFCVYPRFHPLLGLQYYTSGKLEWLLGDTEEAVKSLTKAWDALRITHGTKTPFMMELASKLEEAHAEASYKLRPRNDY
ncbi:histone-lysine N-methyltransferase ASHR1-like [Dorcoceras hygrometricum]|uniref:Histone-lysine N-methyltransferase ASHR1-like n=1 Tax=Dorcoceras hygrometricum TaxID=472368 RepID=A0A2Z7BM59_9LAMI|nr:histone-lysine N-methyltransferase ASHR1-like [Dorcoceras hygrometricum]